MEASHLELLVEEPSMEAFLRALLPRLVPRDKTFEIRAFRGKHDLLGKLEARLRGYASWLPGDWRIVVMVDRDADDCREIKRRLEEIARRAGLRTRTHIRDSSWQLVNRLVIEELEAWYFGDWEAVRAAYPRVSPNTPNQRGYRNPDAIAGGTREAFERVLRRHGYFREGLGKIAAARAIGAHLDPRRSRSHSLSLFGATIAEAFASEASQ